MIHVYWGDGKGKTTAAMGLAMRATGAGWRVVAVQFLKDGASSEMGVLAGLPGVAAVLHDGDQAKFTFRMTQEEKAASRALHDANLARALGLVGCGSAGASEGDAPASCGEGDAPALAAREAAPAPAACEGAAPAVPCLLVLDEALDALRAGLLDEALLTCALSWAHGSADRELVVTGHSLPEDVAEQADYLTRFVSERHPYAQGVAARLGVEY